MIKDLPISNKMFTPRYAYMPMPKLKYWTVQWLVAKFSIPHMQLKHA